MGFPLVCCKDKQTKTTCITEIGNRKKENKQPIPKWAMGTTNRMATCEDVWHGGGGELVIAAGARKHYVGDAVDKAQEM